LNVERAGQLDTSFSSAKYYGFPEGLGVKKSLSEGLDAQAPHLRMAGDNEIALPHPFDKNRIG
jgi:hypothetical protein